MGKITSIYLTDEEAAELKKFCEENQCTQYSALKAVLRELLSKPMKEKEESTTIPQERATTPEYEVMEKTEENKQREEITKAELRKLLEVLNRS